MEMSGLIHAPGSFNPGRDPGTHWMEGWMGPRVGLGAVVRTRSLFLNPVGNRPSVIQPVG